MKKLFCLIVLVGVMFFFCSCNKYTEHRIHNDVTLRIFNE